MIYEYVQVTISLDSKVLGKVKFETGEGNAGHYIKRADILSTPYLFQDERNLKLDFTVEHIKSKTKRLIEIFIPRFD